MVPAKYEMGPEKVLVKEATKSFCAAEYEMTTETVEGVGPAASWFRQAKKCPAASPALLAAIGSSGVKLDEQPVGACLSEYYLPAQYKKEDVRVMKLGL